MKNLYELTTKEKDNYRGQFNELKFTKDINLIRIITLLIIVFTPVVYVVIDDFLKSNDLMQLIDFIWILSFAFYVFYTVYLNISFRRWLKIKHDIQY